MDGWVKIKKGAEYSDISVRTMRDWLKNGLPHSRLPSGTILIKFSHIDEYLENFSVNQNRVDEIIKEVMTDLCNADQR